MFNMTAAKKIVAVCAAVGILFSELPVALAATNNGPRTTASICADLKKNYDINMAYYRGNPSKRGRWRAAAQNLKTLAEFYECSWAV
jgi:hypothetical protein